MPSVSVSRTIAAPAAKIWSILTDPVILASGPFGITRLDGDIQAGGRLALYAEVAGKRAFKLRVREFSPPSQMVWQGGMPLGLFTGTRRFVLTPQGSDTLFHMSETFTGPLAGMIWKSMPDLNPSFEKFASALAQASTGESK